MQESLLSIEEKVAKILSEEPVLRSCDRRLIFRYMKRYHQIYTFEDYAFSKEAPTVESIRRVRQKLQEMGKYLPTESTEDMREREMDRYHNYATEQDRQGDLF